MTGFGGFDGFGGSGEHLALLLLSYKIQDKETGLAPRIFFIFPPFLREGGGGGVRGEGGIPLKSEKKGGQKGGGRGGVDAGKGSGDFLGGGVLNIYFEG